MPTMPGQSAGSAAEPALFDALLTPHRSLGLAAMAAILLLLAIPSVALGVFFMSRGAWPVFGFYGLDILILCLAFRHSRRTARAYERVRLTETALTVEKASHTGRRRVWNFQPNWLRVALDDPPRHGSQLTLGSHGRMLVVGAFLTPAERLALAQALREALAFWRQPWRRQDA